MNLKIYKYKKINNNVVIGAFDGLHCGHLKLINSANRPTVLLMHNIPSKKQTLYKLKERKNILKNNNIKNVLTFSVANNNLNAQNFYNIYLKNKNIKNIIIGENFKFGIDQKTFQQIDVDANVKVIKNLKNVSSTIIKKYIKETRFEEANKLLTENFYIKSRIVMGKKNGRKIGFRTANFKINNNWFISDGIYETKSYYKNKVYKSLTFVGTSKTIVNDKLYSIETHILDFNKNIYYKNLKVEFVRYLGAPKKYKNILDLQTAIKKFIAML